MLILVSDFAVGEQPMPEASNPKHTQPQRNQTQPLLIIPFSPLLPSPIVKKTY